MPPISTLTGAFALLFLSTPLLGAERWRLDRAHSRVTFSVTKWGFAEVEGRFRDFSGFIVHDPLRPSTSRVEWRIKIASVDTGEPNRDRTLQQPEYFDARRFEEMTFVSATVEPVGPQAFQVAGVLTIRGRARLLRVRVNHRGRHEAPGEGTFEIFETRFTVNRYDFGIVGGSLLGPAISKDVAVTLVAAFRRAEP